LIFAYAILLLAQSQVLNAQQKQSDTQPPSETSEKFRVGIAGYSFLKFDIDKTLETMQRVDVHYLCIKDFHLSLSSTDEQITAFKAKLKEKGVEGYAVGPIYMKSEAEVDKAFEYAKKVG
jgi:inosose dehydratase